ncbi:MAG: hypothetical protein HY899_02915 [Deltaproteobacteria bacterium]|nr:hypothetical protein [Deltaproteobacteria bacterium]
MKSKWTLPALALLAAASLAQPALVAADPMDCGQPASGGAKPTVSDCLAILKSAVGQDVRGCADKPCICDVNGDGNITAGDALLCLGFSVGWPVLLNCKCTTGAACTSAELTTLIGSDLDSGWTGLGHNADVVIGSTITARTLRRCSDNDAACVKDSDCGSNDCKATCDCLDDNLCDITGPTHQKHCVTTLANCLTNAECPVGVSCVATFGPPLPLSSGGTPACVVTYFDGLLSGTADAGAGTGVMSANLRSRVHLGELLGRPCPRCGTPAQNPQVGQQFTCEGGQTPGAACTVEGVSPNFGGVSHDCAPTTGSNMSGAGLTIRFNEVTTGTTTKTAKLPCKNYSFTSNPLSGTGKCIDDDLACSSNADCRRCTGDPTTACTGEAQCAGKGTCAEAPDQPISCGFWCQCGFCNNNPSLPCFESGDCPQGQTCQVGTGTNNAQNSPQQKPNDCASDKNICGMEQDERCAQTLDGRCSLQEYRSCNDDSTCQSNGAGVCEFDFRPCFEPRISRTGVPSPLGAYCTDTLATCTANADCGVGGTCANDTSVPQTVALFCVPQTGSPAINNAAGITGPGAVAVKGFIRVCRCGDGAIGCDEQCDDANTVNGDGCDDYCQDE